MPLKSSISSHVRISYRFYEFVTTRYTTDFYIINWFLLAPFALTFPWKAKEATSEINEGLLGAEESY